MMNQQQGSAVGAVMARLKAAEAARDFSIQCDAELIAVMMEARKPAGVRYRAAQCSIEEALASLTDAVKGRRRLGRSHHHLATVAVAHRLDWTAYGDAGDTYPPNFAPTGEQRPELPAPADAVT